jgi:multisubunit Na+/H+ antiporter MnhG subunit
MQWYDYPLIFFGLIGVILALFGSYHGARKSGVLGWILMILALIARISIWIYTMV